jgi:tripartite-type tricarboxylate transporter receptor subunit TctC
MQRCRLVKLALGLVVAADSALRTWTHFVAWAKANPGLLSYGSTGTLTSPHLTMELIAQNLGLELLHVPYKEKALVEKLALLRQQP